MTSVSAGHIILTPTQPVGSGRPQRESNHGPPHQEDPVTVARGKRRRCSSSINYGSSSSSSSGPLWREHRVTARQACQLLIQYIDTCNCAIDDSTDLPLIRILSV